MNLFQKFYDTGMQHLVNFVEIPEKSTHFMLTHVSKKYSKHLQCFYQNVTYHNVLVLASHHIKIM